MRIKYILFCFFWVILFSCNTPKRLNKLMNKLPKESAKECAQRFPVLEKIDTLIITDSALLHAYEMEFIYLYHLVDSLLGSNVDDETKKEIVTIFKEKQVPVYQTKYITKTVESTAKCQVKIDSLNEIIFYNYRYIEGLTAEKEEFGSKYIEAKEDADKYRKQRNRYLWWIILLLIALFRKPLMWIGNKIITKT